MGSSPMSGRHAPLVLAVLFAAALLGETLDLCEPVDAVRVVAAGAVRLVSVCEEVRHGSGQRATGTHQA